MLANFSWANLRYRYFELLQRNIFSNTITTGVTATLGLKFFTWIAEKLNSGNVMLTGYQVSTSKPWSFCLLFGLLSMPTVFWYWKIQPKIIKFLHVSSTKKFLSKPWLAVLVDTCLFRVIPMQAYKELSL